MFLSMLKMKSIFPSRRIGRSIDAAHLAVIIRVTFAFGIAKIKQLSEKKTFIRFFDDISSTTYAAFSTYTA